MKVKAAILLTLALSASPLAAEAMQSETPTQAAKANVATPPMSGKWAGEITIRSMVYRY